MGNTQVSSATLSKWDRMRADRRMLAGETAELEEDTRERRLRDGYLAPADIDQRLQCVREALLRKVHQIQAKAMMVQEQEERVQADRNADLQEECARITNGTDLFGHCAKSERLIITPFALFFNAFVLCYIYNMGHLGVLPAAMADDLMDRERARREASPRGPAPRRLLVLHASIEQHFRYTQLKADVQEEKDTRLIMDALQLRVLPELLRRIHGRLAARLLDEEQQHQQYRHRFAAVIEMVRFAVGRRQATAQAQQAQQACCAEGFSVPFYVEEAKTQVNMAIERRGSVCVAIEAAKVARQEGVAHRHLLQVCEQIERHVAQRMALHAMEEEQEVRVARHKFAEVLTDIARRGNRVRARALIEPIPAVSLSRNLPELLQRSIVDGKQRRTSRAAALERQLELVVRQRMLVVAQELERRAAVQQVVALAEQERARRVHALRSQPLLQSLRAQFARVNARLQSRREQLRRSYHVTTMNPQAKRLMQRCLMQLEMNHRRREISRDLQQQVEQAQHERLLQDSVLPQLVSLMHRREAACLVKEAQAQYVTATFFRHEVVPLLSRRSVRDEIAAAVRQVYLEYLVGPVVGPSPCCQFAHEQVVATIRRQATARRVKEEQQELVNRNRYTEMILDLERSLHRRRVIAEEEKEKARRVHADDLRLVHSELHTAFDQITAALLSCYARQEMVERQRQLPRQIQSQLHRVGLVIRGMAH